MKEKILIIALAATSVVIICSGIATASLHEQIATDPKAISLGNSVTADPPGIMSIHFNPAGLSLIENDLSFSIGLSSTFVNIKGKYTADPDFDGFIGGFTADEAEGDGSTGGISHIPFIDII